MATLGTSWAQVHPSRIEPGVLMQITQASQALRLVADGKPRIMLDPEDLYVYMRTLGMTAQAQVGQTAGNNLPGATLIPKYISTPTYRIRANAAWDHHDSANMSRWGVNIAQGYRLANRQAIFQVLRNMELYGVNAANGEGFLNGGGSATTAQMVKEVAKQTEGDVIEFCYDDTLIGQGSGGADMVVLQMPEVE